MPKITIIISVYNSEKYLKQCLESIKNQTLSDIEIICIDDCSKDNSLKIIEEYAKNDSRFVILKQEVNQGQGIARNKALNVANGEYIMFVDSDDWLESKACEILYNQAKRNNNDLVIFNYYRYLENKKKFIRCTNRTIPFKRINNKTQIKLTDNPNNFFISSYAWVQIYRKNLLKDYNIKFSEHRNCEDDIFNIKAFLYSKSASIIEDCLYNYRIHLDSTYHSTKTITDIVSTKLLCYEEVKKNFNNTKVMDFYLEYSITSLLGIYKRFTKRDKTIRKDFYKKIQRFFIILNKEQNIEKISNNINYSEFKHFISDSYIKHLFLNLLKNIFSVTNYRRKCIKYKVIKILGIKIKFKTKLIVDLVYLWVNGNDQDFAKEKLFWQKKLNIAQDANNCTCRYVDQEELRYSLRSVAKNIPWINKIYIVTNGQVPEWLDITNPKIKIINHSEIMPLDVLPTFNSRAIEFSVANIPGLSEYFLLANDDTFVNKPVKPSFFFDRKCRPIVRLVKCDYSNKEIENSLYIKSIVHSLDIFYNKYKNLTPKTYEPHHNIDAYTKTSYIECIKAFQSEFDELLKQKFRQYSIQRIIQALYLVEQKKSKLELIKWNCSDFKPLKSIYIRINKLDLMIKKLCMHQPVLVCINDVSYAKPEEREDVQFLYEILYPNMQKWEKKVKKIDGNKLKQCENLYKAINKKLFMEKNIHKIFSLKDEYRGHVKHKKLTFMGIKITFKIKGKKK